ncbi:hypothetical protein E8E12_001625 [Didymella heteroderae]|uniref:BTB domain-containing protein n=1 Tax=Didymella heteroderae TaxID=1769908 RepID=A0A9P4WSV5_9PLEO|nr:hypothetical protein E8E12_001625 [Didymella heteroderae]
MADTNISILEPTRKVRRATSAGISDFESVVTINVGIKPDKKTFILHGHALHSSSNYFAFAMDVNCAVAEDDKPIILSDIAVDDFAVYAKFLYTGLLFTKEANLAELARYLHLYKVANHLEAMDFRDAIVDALIETILDFRAFKAAAPFITSSTKSTDMPDPLDLDKSCKYHEHTALGTPCYKTKYQYVPDESVVVAANGVGKPPPAPVTRRQAERQTERPASQTSDDFELRV